MDTQTATVDIVTSAGLLRGAADDGVIVTKGIPFAAPPIGENRFRAPRPHPGWDGVRDALEFGDSPAQRPSPYLPGMVPSEDCLSLNVWTPALEGAKPVIVWIYGGGFESGTSAAYQFDGNHLAASGEVVVVTANHRGGALGFASLRHRGLPEASDLGVQDVIAALEWVQREISAFGGDPARVTVVAQSSGAFIAAALLGAPRAAGLFSSLVLVSGGASRIIPQQVAERLGDDLLAAAGVEDGRDLLDLSTERILDAQRRVGSTDLGRRNGPAPESLGVVLDGTTVTEHPAAAIERGAAAGIRMLFITTGAEARDLRGPDEQFVPDSPAALADEVASWGASQDRASRIAEHYRSGGVDLGVARERMLTDYVYRLPAARSAVAQNAAGGSAWLAQIDQPDGSPAGHSLPALLLFRDLPGFEAIAPLGAVVRETLIGFVRGDEPDWPRFDAAVSPVLHLGAGRTAEPGLFADVLATWDGVPRP